MATEIEAVVFWVMATQCLVGIFDGMLVNGATTQYSNLHMECYSENQAFICLFEKCEYNNPQFKKWRYSLKVYHEIEISNKCPFPTSVHAIIRDTVT